MVMNGSNKPEINDRCLTDMEIAEYAAGKTVRTKRDFVEKHLHLCPKCLGAVIEIKELNSGQDHVSVSSPEEIERAKEKFFKFAGRPAICRCGNTVRPDYRFCPLCGYDRDRGLSRLRSYSWFILSVISLGLSFIYRRYFVQFVVLSAILGLRWAADFLSMKTLIMINQAITSSKDRESSRVSSHLSGRSLFNKEIK